VTIGIALLLMAVGVYAASKMNQELLPPLEFPQTFIFTLQPNASSEDLRDLYTIPLENEIAQIPGAIKAGLETTTVAPASVIIARYEYGVTPSVFNAKVQDAITKVAADGLPVGLKTTADLTPDIMTRVLKRAPSMWKHFDASHLIAMSPDVLDAAFAVDPSFATSLDPNTRNQLAAYRLDSTLNPTQQTSQPVALPGAWVITKDQLPTIKNFSLADLPVLTASVSSSNLSADDLRNFIQKQIVPALNDKNALPSVADVSLSGGQVIPPDILAAAQDAVTKQNSAAPSGTNTQGNNPAPQATAAATMSASAPANRVIVLQQTDTVPALPDVWKSFTNALVLRQYFNAPSAFNTADDLLNTTDKNDNKLTAAAALNLVGGKAGYFVAALTPDIITYLKAKEPDFAKNLTPGTAQLLTADSYAALVGEKPAPVLTDPAWATLAGETGFKKLALVTVRDLIKLKGGAAAGLNDIVTHIPASLNGFAIHLISSLGPDAVAYLSSHEKDFLTNLKPDVLKLMSADTLKSLPADFYSALQSKDSATYTTLQTIIADPSKAAIATLKEPAVVAVQDDPNAPPLPDSWSVLAGFGIKKTDDILRHPFGQPNAAGFFNILAANANAQNLLKDVTPELLSYLESKEPTFYDDLQATTLKLFAPETLAKLPGDVQDRAKNSFIPDNTITRTDGDPALTVSIRKQSASNTVVVSDAIDAVLAKLKADNADKNLTITPIFEQAGFIKDSISGVAREGGLGALMAIIVILLFLNFSIRSTLVTAVSIPTSVAIAFILMYFVPSVVHNALLSMVPAGTDPQGAIAFLLRLFPENLTLNIMTLSGLTVAVGRVVDDSIVVLENIYRQIQSGKDPREAVLQGTADVCVAIFAATLTTVVVFLPIGLTGGLIGAFFLPFGLAVTYALVASFIVAITIVPVMAYLMIGRKNVPEEKEGALEHFYHGLVMWSLKNRWAVLGIAVITLGIGGYLFSTRPTTFLPSFGEPQVTIAISMPNGYPIAQTDVRVQQMEDYLKGLKQDSASGVKSYQTVIGSGGGFAALLGGAGISGNAAQISVNVSVKDEALNNLTAQIRTKAETVFGSPKNVKVSKSTLTDQGFGGFAVVISGSADELQKINEDVKATLSKVPGLTNVTSSLDTVAGTSSRTYLRIGQTAAVQYSGELETQDTLGVTKVAITAVKAMSNLPADLTVGEGFQSQQQTEGFANMIGSLGIAIAIVYLVMVITFGSFVQPFTILFSLPVAVVGAAAGLTITNRVLGISALIGMLMLIGIVVTNAIVLIDRVQANRKHGLSAHDALVEGGRTRLRPILMTAVATMIALLPLAAGASEGAIIASELGTVVIGGLFSSTLLTLLVVPVVYSLIDDAQRVLFRRPAEAAASIPGGEEAGD
jgi:HAE1 family hydrophobic/amphiphilic exporter-1